LWTVDTVADPNRPYTITGAPRLVKDMVVIGNGGADYGVRGYVSAYEQKTGKLRWRFFTVPGSATGPFEHIELEAAAKTWDPASPWATGVGGTVWDSMSWDPELDLLYVGTGNGSPWARFVRSRPRRWPSGLALPDNAGRQLGLHSDTAHHPRRYPLAGQHPQGSFPSTQERLLLRA
jgi:glucose dehydrogenase